MKAYKSPLIMNGFFLLKHEYVFIQPKNNENVDILKTFDQYQLDIDFAFQKDDKDLIQLYTKIEVNRNDKPCNGYSLFVEGMCVFSFDKTVELTEQVEGDLLHVSGLSICINSLRNVLTTTTSNGPFGRYLLPPIDVNLLLEHKYKDLTKDKND